MRANPSSRSFTQCMIHFTTYWLAMYYSMYLTTIIHYLQNTATTLQQSLVQAFHQPSLKLSVFPYFMVSPKFTRNTRTSQPYNQLTPTIFTPTPSFIDHLLQILVRSYPYYLHTSFSLTLQDLYVPDDTLLVAIDVESLYPSLSFYPLNEEMHKHSPPIFDVDLIIHLLHINIDIKGVDSMHEPCTAADTTVNMEMATMAAIKDFAKLIQRIL